MNSPENASVNRPEHPTLSSGLLNGAQEMDTESWSRLVNTFAPIVYGWCRSSGVPESEAADVVQEVFVSVARGIGAFERKKERGSFRSWLATITRNRVRDHYRKLGKRDVAAGGSDALALLQQVPAPTDEKIDSTICVSTAGGLIEKHVVQLVRVEFEPKTWQAFWSTAVDGRTPAEVADTLGMSRSSVYQSKSRVLRRLREKLAQLPE